MLKQPDKRRTAIPKARAVPSPGVNLAGLAAGATYIGSAEHKNYPTAAGHPGKLRKDATECPPELTGQQDLLDGWIRSAIAAGNVTAPWPDDQYPQYAWHRAEDGVVWMGRVVNADKGEYKGWSVPDAEAPSWLA